MALLPLGSLTAVAATASASADADPLSVKAEQKVLEQLDDKGKATFMVDLKGEADLTKANQLTKKADRGAELMRAKKATAKESQANVLEIAKAGNAEAKSFWIANQVQVTATEAVAEKIAALPEVTAVRAPRTIKLDEPIKGKDQASVNGVEWNIDDIKAPDVWNDYGVRGEGIVVANVDTGVDQTHPAVAGTYRGLNADGSFSHDYNWFDPSGVCTGGAPCDNNGHGTHTMGTMVGDDGGANHIGVAPGARWIAAKGCESGGCPEAALLASGQWIVAPTDRQGNNPRPDMAPDVVNNSWGSSAPGVDPWYQEIVEAWRAAGIFPAFSAGNSGSGCNTASSPGNYVASYASGAYDVNGKIASFSSRGTGENGAIKPNIASPGVNVRSSVPGGGYQLNSGTSMASPHTAGAVALLWSASPALRGEVEATEEALNQSARDTENLQCGGTAENNNVFGEGKLDVKTAVDNAPRGSLGSLGGTVLVGGEPLAGATITAEGPIHRSVTTRADGTYSLPTLIVGDYQLTASKFGYRTAHESVTIAEAQTASANFDLVQTPTSTVSGTVSSEDGPAAGAVVSFANTPVSATTDAQGHYSAVIPNGDYTLKATSPSRCVSPASREISVSGDTTADFSLTLRLDTFRTACRTGTAAWVEGDTKLNLVGDDVVTSTALPFAFPFYGRSYSTAWINTNGLISFGGASTFFYNTAIPTAAAPNAALYPFWDDLAVDAKAGGVYTKAYGTAPHRKFVIEWRKIHPFGITQSFSFSAEISETGAVTYRYKDVPSDGRFQGNSATIGVENANGTDALQYSNDEAVIDDGTSISFHSTTTGVLWGKVTDANDGLPVDGATVTAGTASTVTDAEGLYLLQAPVGQQNVKISAPAYQDVEKSADVRGGELTEVGASLATGVVTTKSTDGITAVVPGDDSRKRTVTLTNGGSEADWTATEDEDWLTLDATEGTVAKGAEAKIELSFDTKGLTPGQVYSTDLVVHSESGRSPEIVIPVRMVVPAYLKALDIGADDPTAADVNGDSWAADQEYRAGGYGWIGRSVTTSTKSPIAGIEDDARFTTAREGMLEYRFDNVPDGVYRVDLDFAEIGGRAPTKRVFDVMAEGKLVEPNLDIALEAGQKTALVKTYTVTVTDGQLNLRFVAGDGKTLVNAVRVAERPDLA
ncbi:S8 family serine peptidase [Streptomyces sp. NPDC057565]|uniref:S8 family serine peptidase n=1 Tax=Streptomyces sp. NPDC057565 TaxID=3346169 RepID=UPI0036A0BFC8